MRTLSLLAVIAVMILVMVKIMAPDKVSFAALRRSGVLYPVPAGEQVLGRAFPRTGILVRMVSVFLAKLRARRGMRRIYSGRPEEARQEFEIALRWAVRSRDLGVCGQALVGLGEVAFSQVRTAQALEIFHEVARTADLTQQQYLSMYVAVWRQKYFDGTLEPIEQERDVLK